MPYNLWCSNESSPLLSGWARKTGSSWWQRRPWTPWTCRTTWTHWTCRRDRQRGQRVATHSVCVCVCVCMLGVTSATPHVVHYWGDRILVWRSSWLKCSRFRAGSLPIWRSMDRWLHVKVPLAKSLNPGSFPVAVRSACEDRDIVSLLMSRLIWMSVWMCVCVCVCVWIGECSMCCKADKESTSQMQVH